MRKVKTFVFSITVLIFLSFVSVSAQKWRQIIPLTTKCEDLLKILEIKKCEYPVTLYKSDNFSASINFSAKNKSRKTSETVISALIVLNKAIKLKDFEADLTGFDKTPETDYDAWIYTNEEKGIRFTTQIPGGEEYVEAVDLFPPKKKK